MQKEVNPSNLNYAYRFFCWCSGARLYILKHCPTDYNKFLGIGIIVIFTGIMAAISGGYALFTIFHSVLPSLIFGIIWGLLIFFLDWYILASLKKEKQFSKEFLNTLPRILLAILLGLIISKPLELKLFEKEIAQELLLMQKELDIDYKNRVFNEFNEIELLQNQNELLSKEIKQKETYRDSLFNLIIEEAEGRSPTSIIGKGPVYKEKKQAFDRVNIELQELKERNLTSISDNEIQIKNIQANRDLELKSGTESTKSYDGFLAQIQALSSLSDKNQDIKYVNIFVILLFIIIESSPMLVKLMAPRGVYDIYFEFEEQKTSAELKKKIAMSELEHLKYVETEIELEAQKIKSKNSIQKHQITKTEEAKKEILTSNIKKWRDSEMENKTTHQNSITEEQLFSF